MIFYMKCAVFGAQKEPPNSQHMYQKVR